MLRKRTPIRKSRFARPRVERLEDRTLPSLTPFLVKDINPDTQNSNPAPFAELNGNLFFSAQTNETGSELWKTDGTAEGTMLVKDINPGPGFADIAIFPNVAAVMNGLLFFTASDGTHGIELWRTDGTEAGTVMVKDIRPGTGSGRPIEIAQVGGTLYFSAQDGAHGGELWKSDGTEAGTVMVKDIRPGTGSSDPAPVVVGDRVLFGADDGVNGRELWKSDGTAAGTVLVKDINPGSAAASPGLLVDVNGTLFFNATTATNGSELWKSDGTAAGTVLVKDIRLGTGSSGPRSLTNVNGTLFFVANDGTNGFPSANDFYGELWRSDGTAAGTVLVKDIRPGTNGSFTTFPSTNSLTNVNGTLFFVADNGSSGKELWKSDGTAAGTVLVKDIRPGAGAAFDVFRPLPLLTKVGGSVFFAANDGVIGRELWKSDGTAAGTVLVRDIQPGANGSGPDFLAALNGALLFFSANDGDTGAELWKSDGNAAGTMLVRDINLNTQASSPANLTDVNGTLFFTANDGSHGTELWKSDGTETGTVLVKDLNPGEVSSAPDGLLNVNGTLFFVADDGNRGRELWKTDGTLAGTVLVKDINPGSVSSTPGGLLNVNGVLLFRAFHPTTGIELWKSDGTEAGTLLVKDIRPGTGNSIPGVLNNVNGVVFFTANDGSQGSELWKSDGTAAGTVLVKDINLGSASAGPGELVNVNGTLFFTANDTTHGLELWKSDGTEPGTALVKDIRPGSGSSAGDGRAVINNTLFFVADDGIHNVELWKSDGTEAGTVMVKDINPGSGFSFPSSLTNLNGTLLFRASDGSTGSELWKSDGTEPGTVRIRDINPGSGNSFPGPIFLNVAGTLFFNADDGTGGELWRTDGTTAGTVLVADILPGAGGSSPDLLTDVSGIIFLRANHPSYGVELWKVVEVVQIDIKPGSYPNTINLGSNGTVPVAILSTETFNAATVDPLTVALAGAAVTLRGNGTAQASPQDVNGDGRLDLVVHVSTEALQLTDGDVQAVLTGRTYSDLGIQGSDTVRIVNGLHAAAVGSGSVGAVVTPVEAEALVWHALALWTAALGLSSCPGVTVVVEDLPDNLLGTALGSVITLDADAAGWGWFVDPTPWNDSEFLKPGDEGEQNRMDMLSVLSHELGHVLGFDHADGEDVMAETLAPGQGRLPQLASHQVIASEDKTLGQPIALPLGWFFPIQVEANQSAFLAVELDEPMPVLGPTVYRRQDERSVTHGQKEAPAALIHVPSHGKDSEEFPVNALDFFFAKLGNGLLQDALLKEGAACL